VFIVATPVSRPAVAVSWPPDRLEWILVAFGCANRAELENWARRLDELGVEHGQIKDASYGSGVSFRDPDGIALEFFAPPG